MLPNQFLTSISTLLEIFSQLVGHLSATAEATPLYTKMSYKRCYDDKMMAD